MGGEWYYAEKIIHRTNCFSLYYKKILNQVQEDDREYLNEETPAVVTARVLVKRLFQAFKIWHRPTLPRVTAVPSALVGLTSLFGMGRGGHHRYRHLNVFK